MDPKMDQCANLAIGKKKQSELFHVELPADMTLYDLVPIFMKMMILESAFLQGYSLIESTHNCVLMWPQAWKHLETDSSLIARLLVTYGKSSLKTVSRLFSFITTTEIYEGILIIVVYDYGNVILFIRLFLFLYS